MNNLRFVYDERTSCLYAPDGSFIKRAYCPKAKQWNQLALIPGENRWRNCATCKERVVDLDAIEVDAALAMFHRNSGKLCVHASENSKNVIFLKDPNNVPPAGSVDLDSIQIHTAWGEENIQRGFAMGYWPDVRILKQDPKMNSRVSVGQNPTTGEVAFIHDLRLTFRKGTEDFSDSYGRGFEELHAFTSYFPYDTSDPVAAYLVPKGLPNGTPVTVLHPIENLLGVSWNQGGGSKATNVPAHIENNHVVLELAKVKVSHVVG